jgi:heme-degrading monooxygenase HmoA
MVIVMNVIHAAPERDDEVQHAFVTRERHLDGVDGFISFDLLRRADEELEGGPAEFVVATRWESFEAFEAWISSDAFFSSHAHRDPSLTHSLELRTYEVLQVDPTAAR